MRNYFQQHAAEPVHAADGRRAKLILMLDDGESRDAIMSALGCDSRFIAHWSGRFLNERLAGMYVRHPGRAPVQPPARLEARVLSRALKHKPADGSTHWSSYKLAAELGDVSVSAVQRIWRKHGIKPQRLERHMKNFVSRISGVCSRRSTSPSIKRATSPPEARHGMQARAS